MQTCPKWKFLAVCGGGGDAFLELEELLFVDKVL